MAASATDGPSDLQRVVRQAAQQLSWEERQSGRPSVPGMAQLYPDPVPRRQTADDVEPERARQRQVDRGWVEQSLIDLHEVLVAHPDTRVLDLQDVAGRGEVT